MKIAKKSLAIATLAALFLAIAPLASATEGTWEAGGPGVVLKAHPYLSTLIHMFSTALKLIRL